MFGEIIPLVSAITAATIYALGGYLNRPEEEPFCEEKFVTTLMIGVVVGVVSFFASKTLDVTTQLLTSTGIVVLIEKYGKAGYRKLKKWLAERK